MINFSDKDSDIRRILNNNNEYRQFVMPDNETGYVFIQVANGHVVLFHNIDNTFSTFLMPDELYDFSNNIDDIQRIAKTLRDFANYDYQTNLI